MCEGVCSVTVREIARVSLPPWKFQMGQAECLFPSLRYHQFYKSKTEHSGILHACLSPPPFSLAVLGMEPRDSCMLGMHVYSEQPPAQG